MRAEHTRTTHPKSAMRIDFDFTHRCVKTAASSVLSVRTALLSLVTMMMFCDEAFAFRLILSPRMRLSGSSSHSIDASSFGKYPKQYFCRGSHLTTLNVKEVPGDSDDVEAKPAKPFDKGASEFVPLDMQPANEWVMLKKDFLFDWPLLPKDVCIHLGLWHFPRFL